MYVYFGTFSKAYFTMFQVLFPESNLIMFHWSGDGPAYIRSVSLCRCAQVTAGPRILPGLFLPKSLSRLAVSEFLREQKKLCPKLTVPVQAVTVYSSSHRAAVTAFFPIAPLRAYSCFDVHFSEGSLTIRISQLQSPIANETGRPLYMDSDGRIIDPWIPLFFVSFIIVVGQFLRTRGSKKRVRASHSP